MAILVVKSKGKYVHINTDKISDKYYRKCIIAGIECLISTKQMNIDEISVDSKSVSSVRKRKA